jgi:hypothetical protein
LCDQLRELTRRFRSEDLLSDDESGHARTIQPRLQKQQTSIIPM